MPVPRPLGPSVAWARLTGCGHGGHCREAGRGWRAGESDGRLASATSFELQHTSSPPHPHPSPAQSVSLKKLLVCFGAGLVVSSVGWHVVASLWAEVTLFALQSGSPYLWVY
ncbi:hypothetical protein DPEC_G00077110 [Dallia pectoralis]|uniref:Uncharacterized protein n=1 Tax=Dallia pectoralis TaxID=75939 RepID=A0ACC2H3Q4_DALPE|nr:hypothetical protein DPEC_G00077110 [Dallia pectoralis]